MNRIYFNTQENAYGISVYKDDNEYALVNDDGSIKYYPKEVLRYATGPEAR